MARGLLMTRIYWSLTLGPFAPGARASSFSLLAFSSGSEEPGLLKRAHTEPFLKAMLPPAREFFRGAGHHGGGLGSTRTPGCQGGSGSILPLREERGVDEDLPPGGEQREGPHHQSQLLGDCGREARRLWALRGRAVRGWASPDHAWRPSHRPGNAHRLCFARSGQGRRGQRGQVGCWCGTLTAHEKPTSKPETSRVPISSSTMWWACKQQKMPCDSNSNHWFWKEIRSGRNLDILEFIPPSYPTLTA